MQRLTLILSDLYLPEDSVKSEVPRTHELPAFDWLLRFADRPLRIADWRRWLLAQTGHRPDDIWLATPVHLEARLDHARLVDRGLIRLGSQERHALRDEFAKVFGPQFELRDAGVRGFELAGLGAAGVRTVDPARLLGAEIGPAIPAPEAADLRRLWAEIEMWLHSSTVNTAREKSRQRRVSALWLWRAPSVALRDPRTPGAAQLFLGDDPLMRRLSGASHEQPPVSAFPQPDANSSGSVFAEFAPLSGQPHETLPALEAGWFAPARDALREKRLESVQVVANDRVFTVKAGADWKIWRRRRAWLQSLA